MNSAIALCLDCYGSGVGWEGDGPLGYEARVHRFVTSLPT